MAMTNLIAALIVVGHLTEAAQQPASTIAVPPLYKSAVGAMLRYSPTFQRQYRRLVRATDVRVEIAPALLPGGFDGALTRIVRGRSGLEAGVRIGPGGDPVLL